MSSIEAEIESAVNGSRTAHIVLKCLDTGILLELKR